MTEQYIRSIEAQIIGRVFTHDGAIHFVLDTNGATGMARCSRRTQDGPAITYLPMTDIHQFLINQGRVLAVEADAAPDEDDLLSTG